MDQQAKELTGITAGSSGLGAAVTGLSHHGAAVRQVPVGRAPVTEEGEVQEPHVL